MYPIGKRGRKALVELWGLEFIHYFFGYCREHGYGMERNDADAVRIGRRRTDGDGCVHPFLWRFPAKRAARELAILSADF